VQHLRRCVEVAALYGSQQVCILTTASYIGSCCWAMCLPGGSLLRVHGLQYVINSMYGSSFCT
jgi:hypothetical protein